MRFVWVDDPRTHTGKRLVDWPVGTPDPRGPFRFTESAPVDEEWVQRCQDEADEFDRLVEAGEIVTTKGDA